MSNMGNKMSKIKKIKGLFVIILLVLILFAIHIIRLNLPFYDETDEYLYCYDDIEYSSRVNDSNFINFGGLENFYVINGDFRLNNLYISRYDLDNMIKLFSVLKGYCELHLIDGELLKDFGVIRCKDIDGNDVLVNIEFDYSSKLKPRLYKLIGLIKTYDEDKILINTVECFRIEVEGNDYNIYNSFRDSLDSYFKREGIEINK